MNKKRQTQSGCACGRCSYILLMHQAFSVPFFRYAATGELELASRLWSSKPIDNGGRNPSLSKDNYSLLAYYNGSDGLVHSTPKWVSILPDSSSFFFIIILLLFFSLFFLFFFFFFLILLPDSSSSSSSFFFFFFFFFFFILLPEFYLVL